MAQQLNEVDPYNYPLEGFYAFVWSGKLCFKERMTAAEKLYASLQETIREYHELYGCIPKIRLITVSHGGNVALNMAQIHKHKDKLAIDELVMLCCPVQHETEDCLQSPLFKKVYSLYSTADYLQKLDPQGVYQDNNHRDKSFFSGRRFKPHAKLKQVRIKVNGFTIGHLQFGSHKFMRLLPPMLNELSQWVMNTPVSKDRQVEYILSMHSR